MIEGNSMYYIDSLVGWSIAYNYTQVKNKEDEIKQGKNFYLSSTCLTAQLAQLGVLISKINETLPEHPLKNSIKVLCSVGPLLAFPGFLFCAAVKQGDYENLSKWYNQSNYNYIKLPKSLEGRTVSVFSFFAEHSGDLMRIAMIGSSIALIALGKRAYGAAILTAMAYQCIDQMGFIPRRISLFMERYIPTISIVGSLIGGTIFVRVIAVMVLATKINTSLTKYIHQKVDDFIRLFFTIEGPRLTEIDAPVVKREEMTFDEIMHIIDSHSWDYKLNPAHCNQSTMNLDDFPEDHDFEKYLTLFDTIDWKSKYTLVRNKLKDDDRFIDFLFEKYPEVNKDDLANDVEDYIQQLALKEGITAEEYTANWLREQCVQLTAVLRGEKRVKGSQQDLDEAIHVSAILLPYLLSLENEIELEDHLLKLAVEAGDYCGRGIKRAANELFWSVMQKGIEQEDESDDPVKNYEMKMNQTLQNKRYELIQGYYKAFLEQLNVPDVVTQDIHGFDIYRIFFSLGFFPLTQFERNRLSVLEIATWELYTPHRTSLQDVYHNALDNVIQETGEAEFGIYMLQMISQNELLSDKEKEEILEKFTEQNNGTWSPEETIEHFHRLLLVRLGVLIPNSTGEELPEEESLFKKTSANRAESEAFAKA